MSLSSRKAIAQWFRESRKNAGLSQEDLAKKLGVSQPMISIWENGNAEPSHDTIQKISLILGADFEKTLETPPLGEWIRKKREEKGLSRNDLAKEAGISPLTIYFIETGKTESPQRATLVALEKTLGELPSNVEEEVRGERQVEELEFLGPFPIDGWEENVGQGKIQCVYVFYDELMRPVRIGETDDLRRRMKEYQRDCWWFRSPTVESYAYVVINNAEFRHKTQKVMIKLVGEHAIFNIQEKI
jgi:transcriptional regulator with XRE-family HTH domain